MKLKTVIKVCVASILSAFAAILTVTSIYATKMETHHGMYHHENQADNVLGYAPIPSHTVTYYEQGRHKTIKASYDKFGARVVSLKQPSKIPSKLIVVGGSLTNGHGVLAEETFTNKLANLLKVHAVNLGVSSYGGTSSLIRLKQNTYQFHPKYIVYGMWSDHIKRNVMPCVESSFPTCLSRPVIRKTSDGKLFIAPTGDTSKELKLNSEWYGTKDENINFWYKFRWTLRKIIWSASLKTPWSPMSNTLNTPTGRIQAENYVLREMARVAKNVNAKLIVVYFPSYFGETIEKMPNRINKIARKDDFLLINMHHEFTEMKKKHINIGIPLDGHFTPAAHQIIAAAIFKGLTTSQSKG